MKCKKMISVLLTGCLLLTSGIMNGLSDIAASAVSNKTRVSVHDPSIFKNTDGTYYVFGHILKQQKQLICRTGHVLQMVIPQQEMYCSEIFLRILLLLLHGQEKI